MRRVLARSTVAALACALMVGCSDGADPAPEDPSTSGTASSPTPSASEEASASAEDTESEEPESESESEGTESESESESESEGTESEETEGAAASQTLALEQRHPNGSVMRVTSLQIEATSMTVGIDVVNGSETEMALASALDDVSLIDDLGGVYEFVRPTDNTNLSIPARGTLTGELVYFGILNPEATSLRLQTNDFLLGSDRMVYDPATEATSERSPHFSFEIPLAP